MAEYKQEDCPFVYRIEAVTKVVDGDTVDCVFDLGFDKYLILLLFNDLILL